MLKVRSTLFAKDANKIMAWFHREGKIATSILLYSNGDILALTGTSSELWLSTCQTFMSHLTTHVDSLSAKLAGARAMKDEEGCVALSFSSIISFTTLSQILITLARNPLSTVPARVRFMHECNTALQSVFSTVEKLKPLELRFMDMYLGVGAFLPSSNAKLTMLLGTLDSRTIDFLSSHRCNYRPRFRFSNGAGSIHWHIITTNAAIGVRS